MIPTPSSDNRSSPALQIAVAVSFPVGAAIALAFLFTFLPTFSLVLAILGSLLFGMLVSFVVGRRVADIEHKRFLEGERNLRVVREEETQRQLAAMRKKK